MQIFWIKLEATVFFLLHDQVTVGVKWIKYIIY